MAAANGRQEFERLLAAGLAECGVARGAKLLVALSGGPDSTALLLALLSLAPGIGLHVEAAHFNHHLRGEESDLDEQFCSELCRANGVKLSLGGEDVKKFARARRVTVEAAARELRYGFLVQVAHESGCYGAVTAHTLDDQAETVLLALTRGAGLRGLAGMRPVTVRPGGGETPALKVLRPLLKVRKDATAVYCQARDVEPREDSSNRDLRYARNRIRRRVLPELAMINSEVTEALARLAENARSGLSVLDEVAARELTKASAGLGKKAISRQHIAALSNGLRSLVLSAAYREAAGSLENLGQAHIAAMSDLAISHSGGSLDLPDGVQMLVDYDAVRFVKREQDDEQDCPYPIQVDEVRLYVPGTHRFSDGSEITASIVSPPRAPESLTEWQALLDASLADEQLSIRSRRDGDRFHPLGMSGPVKLQDFFVNQHVPARWRDRVPLVMAQDRIAWVTGQRVTEWAKTSEQAEKALLVEFRTAARSNS